MATEVTVGQTLPLSLAFLDQNGQAMVTQPVVDAPSAWANLNPSIETVTPSSDGLTADAVALAAGTDTVRVQLSVNGAQFTATLDVAVAPAMVPGQTLTSIGIVAGTPH